MKGAHHGGAWKVAYADFVTAMMALFLVLWLTSQDQRIRDAVERAFNHPFSSPTPSQAGIIPGDKTQVVRNTNGNFDSASKAELDILRQIHDDLLSALPNSPDEESQRTLSLELSPDSLRISVFDRARKAIFLPDSTTLTDYGKWVLTTLAWRISRYDSFLVEVEGHTETTVAPRPDGDDWELSSSRANVARRLLLQHGVRSAQVRRVAGYADTMPLPHVEPTDESNRRITVMLRVNNAKPT
jgi:chemotaxis protein MotB